MHPQSYTHKIVKTVIGLKLASSQALTQPSFIFLIAWATLPISVMTKLYIFVFLLTKSSQTVNISEKLKTYLME